MVKQNKTKLYFYYFFHNLIFAYVIERLFWESRGITIAQVVYLEIIYAFVLIVLEIPTGYLADRFSRKVMMIISAVTSFLEFYILILAHNFLTFSLAIGIAAIGKAMSSGTSNALLYDSMKVSHEEEHFESALSKLRFFDGLATAVAALLGGLLAVHFRLVTNYQLSLISTLIAFVISLTLVEPSIKMKDDEAEHHYIKDSLKFFKNNPSVVIVVINSFVVAATMDYIDEFWQLYLRDISFPVYLFGVFSLTTSLVGSIGGLLAPTFKKKLGYKKSFIVTLIIFLIGLMGLGQNHDLAGLVYFGMVYFPVGILQTLVYGYLHHHADSTYRATAESVQSLGNRVVSTVIGLAFAYIATHYSLTKGFFFLSLFMSAFIGVYILFLNRRVKE